MQPRTRFLGFLPFLLLAACAPKAGPDGSTPAATYVQGALDRAALARIAFKARPISNIPPDHRIGMAFLGPETHELFTGYPHRCVVVHLISPRGPRSVSIGITKTGPDVYKVAAATSGYEVPSCDSAHRDLTLFPELEAMLAKREVRPGAYCEALNGAGATPGAPWQCRYDGQRGFPSGRAH